MGEVVRRGRDRSRELERRRLRREAVEAGYAVGLQRCVELGLGLVELAHRELQAAESGSVVRVDPKVLDLGLKAADRVLDRVVGKVGVRVEGEITHSHVFEQLRDAVRQAVVIDAEVVEEE